MKWISTRRHTTRQNKTYIEDDCHLAEASQEVVPYTCRMIETTAQLVECVITILLLFLNNAVTSHGI